MRLKHRHILRENYSFKTNRQLVSLFELADVSIEENRNAEVDYASFYRRETFGFSEYNKRLLLSLSFWKKRLFCTKILTNIRNFLKIKVYDICQNLMFCDLINSVCFQIKKLTYYGPIICKFLNYYWDYINV